MLSIYGDSFLKLVGKSGVLSLLKTHQQSHLGVLGSQGGEMGNRIWGNSSISTVRSLAWPRLLLEQVSKGPVEKHFHSHR